MKSRAWLAVLSLLALCSLGALGAVGALEVTRNGPARNAILFIGDGMAISTLTAARIHGPGPGGKLALELPHTALVRTYSLDRLVTDSAASATALLAGERVPMGVIGMSPETKRACSLPRRRDGSLNPAHPCAPAAAPIPSLAELAAQAGMAVGVVTNTRITHATPAALYAHVDERELESEIAAQLVAQRVLSFVVGGGRGFFSPHDLMVKLRVQGVTYVETGAALKAAVQANAERILVLLAPDHFGSELDQPGEEAEGRLLSLAELTALALQQLSRNEGGYFLLVEGGRIDHAQHLNLARAALRETLAFDQAVAAARRLTDEKDTLILVTSDHGHPLVMVGYPLVGDSILAAARGLGIERQDADGDGLPDYLHTADGKPMNTLLFANGPRSAVRLPYSTHEGSDVFASAVGPGAEQVRGFLDQVELFQLLRSALGL